MAVTSESPRKPRRWLASVIAASSDPASLPALPFQRGQRRRPAAFEPKPAAVAAPVRLPGLAAH